MTLTMVPGLRVGHWTEPEGRTGVTVVVFPEPNVAAAEVRGAAPATREVALLESGMLVETVQAVVLTGGSAFGLAAADGVCAELEREGRGFPTPTGPVPIVPAAAIYDLAAGDPSARPGPEQGRTAYRSAGEGPVEMGLVGAGTGATVGAWRGMDTVRPGGIGSASIEVSEGLVGALVVLNAAGDVFSLEGEPLTGGSPEPPLRPAWEVAFGSNTTLVVVATDAQLSRDQLRRVAIRAQDALAACLRPGHTRYDGDTAFVVSCGDRSATVDEVGEAAFIAVGRSLEGAVLSSGAVQEAEEETE